MQTQIRIVLKFLLALFLVAWSQIGIAAGQESSVAIAEQASPPQRDTEELEADVRSFDQVWETIRDRNWDADFDMESWEAARDTYRPRVESSASIHDTRKIMGEMISSLNKSHYGIIPSHLYDKIKSAKEEKDEKAREKGDDDEDEEESELGESGLSIRFVDGEALVTDIEIGSAAEEAGVQVGWLLRKYRQQVVAELYDEIKSEIPETSPVRIDTLSAMALEGKIKGDVGDSVDLVFLDANDTAQEMSLTFKATTGNRIQFGHLPEMVVKSESKVIDGDIGYVWFNIFFDPVNVMKEISKAVRTAETGKGIILDLRGNHGGLGGMTMGVGNHFVSDKTSFLGTLKMKENKLKFFLSPRARPYKGPVAVLVDECSISSAEILAGGLQAINRGRVFGVQTAGAALPSTVEMLPNKDRFQFAIAGYTDSDGRNIEGTGVTPDVPIRPSREALLDGSDPIMDAAVAWINEQAAAATPE